MLKTEQLQQYLSQYKSLPLHQDASLKQVTLTVMDWQKYRIEKIHQNIFHLPQYQSINTFFFTHFYHLDALELLAQQLELALEQKIKLDRWLPKDVLDTISNGFQLALITLEADCKIAKTLLQKGLEPNTENILDTFLEVEQTTLRLHQLDLLQAVTAKLYKFAHSFLLRSALKIAYPKIEQRGFMALHGYVEDGIKAMRSNKKSLVFFRQLVRQEKMFLHYLNHHHLIHLDVYYDALKDQITVLPQKHG